LRVESAGRKRKSLHGERQEHRVHGEEEEIESRHLKVESAGGEKAGSEK
jgi:hypothetical protein